MEFPPSETVAIPPRESGVGNYIVGDKMLCAQQSIPTKYFTLAVISPFSSNVSVLRERIIARNADKICKRTREKMCEPASKLSVWKYREKLRTH